MVDILSRANRDVKLPACKQTHARIIDMFKQQMDILKDRLNVSDSFLILGLIRAYTRLTEPGCDWPN